MSYRSPSISASNVTAPVNTVTSFVSAPFMNMKNAAVHTANSVSNAVSLGMKNTAQWMKNAPVIGDIAEPIVDSYNQAINSGSASTDLQSMVSIPLVLFLGVLIIFFILFTVFRDPMTLWLERAWGTVKGWFSPSSASAASAAATSAPAPAGSQQTVAQPLDRRALEKMMPPLPNAMSGGGKEVFNIADNKYKYSEANALCKSFGAELATYDQVKAAWDKGADWCNYGWIKGQAAVYPTQQSTYDKIQSGPEEARQSCGVPGVNGGYFDNPDLRFGVNCYGIKPAENDADIRHAQTKDGLSPGALAFDHQVQNFKQHHTEMSLNPFKEGVWSG